MLSLFAIHMSAQEKKPEAKGTYDPHSMETLYSVMLGCYTPPPLVVGSFQCCQNIF